MCAEKSALKRKADAIEPDAVEQEDFANEVKQAYCDLRCQGVGL
jgi:hypothetical protein